MRAGTSTWLESSSRSAHAANGLTEPAVGLVGGRALSHEVKFKVVEDRCVDDRPRRHVDTIGFDAKVTCQFGFQSPLPSPLLPSVAGTPGLICPPREARGN